MRSFRKSHNHPHEGFSQADARAVSPAHRASPRPSPRLDLHVPPEDAKQAGSDTLNAAKHAGEGTATALRDTKITTKVKYALHEDKITGNYPIHVTTVAGVVTLSGRVPSPHAAARAEQLARQTEGVKGVNNQLSVDSAKLD